METGRGHERKKTRVSGSAAAWKAVRVCRSWGDGSDPGSVDQQTPGQRLCECVFDRVELRRRWVCCVFANMALQPSLHLPPPVT